MRIRKTWLILIAIVVLSFAVLVWYLGFGGLIAVIFESLLLIVLTNPERAMGFIATLLTHGRKIHFWFERNAVEKRLESSIGLSSKKVNEEGIELLPHAVDVKWVQLKDRDAFLKEDKIVVCLESSLNESRNLARATMLYTSADLIRESQRFVDRKVMKSACFAVTRKMLMIDRRLAAVKCLDEEFLQPEITKSSSIKKYVETMDKLDSEGVFTRLLLNELSELGTRFGSSLSNPRAEKETVSFMDTMKKLSEKQKGVDVTPDHRGQVIDVGIILIAREGVRSPTPYIRFAKKCWKEGLPRLYVLAQGKRIVIGISAVLGIKTNGIYRVEKESKFWIPKKKGGFESYVAVLSRIEA